MKTIECNRSKTGLPVIAESGGGMSNTGFAQVICGENGEKLVPLFVPRGYSNADHALFVAMVGNHVIESRHSRSVEYVTVFKIVQIGTENNPDLIVLEEIAGYENGDGNIPEQFQPASDAALKKAHHYHCRSAYWVGEKT